MSIFDDIGDAAKGLVSGLEEGASDIASGLGTVAGGVGDIAGALAPLDSDTYLS